MEGQTNEAWAVLNEIVGHDGNLEVYVANKKRTYLLSDPDIPPKVVVDYVFNKLRPLRKS